MHPNYHVSRITFHAPYVLCLLILLVGCGGKTSEFELSPQDVETLQPILDELQLRYEFTDTLNMGLIVTIEEDGKKEEVREHLWYKKSETDGDLLHVQAMGPLNEPRAIAIAARNQFLFCLVNEQEAIFEPLADQVLGEIFGIDLRVSDVRTAIFANPFLDKRTQQISLTVSGTKYVVKRPYTVEGQIEETTIFLRNSEAQVMNWTIRDKDGKIHQQAKFSDYREAGGILRPYKVEIERPLDRTRVVFKVIKPEINGSINDSKFEFDRFLARKAKVRSLDE